MAKFNRRSPTAAERKRWQASAKNVDIAANAEQVREILEQLRQTDIATVVDRLKSFRESKEISLRVLEESSGIPRGNLSRIENHLHTPGLTTLQSYAAALGKSVRVVLVDDE